MNATANSYYLKGIAENDFAVLKKVYDESLPEVIKHIKRNSGTIDDAKDVFQEAIMVVYKKLKNNNLELTTTFHIYLFSVCKRIWLKKLKKKGKREVTFEDNEAFAYEEEYEEVYLKRQKWALFNKKLEQLTTECKTVLQMLFTGSSSKAIATKMGYTEEYAKRKKYKCKISLAALIKSDPEYQALVVQ
jgi:RNA polymerase sigma factor (sigma-70 family)